MIDRPSRSALVTMAGVGTIFPLLASAAEAVVTLISRRHQAYEPVDATRQTVSAIIPVAWPNEQSIMADTLRYFDQIVLPHVVTVLFVFNGRGANDRGSIDALVHEYSDRMEFIVAPEITSKADALNEALLHIDGDIIVLYDADARPEPAGIERARARLQEHCIDVIQGANFVRAPKSALGLLVAAESFEKHSLSFPARAHWDGTYFTGSNAYWRADVLKQLSFRDTSLTEDIELSMRGRIAGVRITYDEAVVSWELAPRNALSWFRQRRRWSAGWNSAARTHAIGLMRTGTRRSRVLWVYLTLRRPAPSLFTVAFATLVFPLRPSGRTVLLCYIWAAALSVPNALALLARAPYSRIHRVGLGMGALITGPLYCILKNLTTFSSLVHPPKQWQVTRR